MRDWHQLRDDALAIWSAGVAAVDSSRLVRDAVRIEPNSLWLDDIEFPLAQLARLVVVGGGKAGVGMADGLIEALGDPICQRVQLAGWLNVPDDCVRAVPHITVHGARPAGVNEPSQRGVEGTRRMLEWVSQLGPDDLCVCLLSGGGSALMPAPADGLTLDDKLRLTRFLSAAGANIQQLNTVRKQLSDFKGGRLAARCRAGYLVTLIISDVLGDPLDLIASGPTATDRSTAAEALRVLDHFAAMEVAPRATDYLRRRDAIGSAAPCPTCRVAHRVIGNNATAVDAAGIEAERRGYRHAMISAQTLEGEADVVGRHLASMADDMLTHDGPDCLISGGEPVVRLSPAAIRGLGGRNQQLVLAAYDWLSRARTNVKEPCQDLVILSGGTDGEDGPTDAAGAWIDGLSSVRIAELSLDAADALARNDAYPFFAKLGTLIKTGPTHTNVCDLRVVVVNRD